MTTQQQKDTFVHSLTSGEKNYLWSHIFRYAGVEGMTAPEQFDQIIMYVLNFLDGEANIEQRIYAKALLMF